ncbi:hypothetical protein GCM10007063_22860 [Lentibacillus kapialis]|uniref:Uncharacterized protein n=1 Tax=Lentibacillus kapialis TaxID=340214 RepID=A0A917UZH8_9BACI|nr:hypothetical protein GCM10007063_22860 [Lentibacillus kapialis]
MFYGFFSFNESVERNDLSISAWEFSSGGESIGDKVRTWARESKHERENQNIPSQKRKDYWLAASSLFLISLKHQDD